MLTATMLSGGGGHWEAREHAVRCERPIKSACTSDGECGANLRVWFGFGWNKFVHLLIRSRNSSSQFVRSLVKIRVQ